MWTARRPRYRQQQQQQHQIHDLIPAEAALGTSPAPPSEQPRGSSVGVEVSIRENSSPLEKIEKPLPLGGGDDDALQPPPGEVAKEQVQINDNNYYILHWKIAFLHWFYIWWY